MIFNPFKKRQLHPFLSDKEFTDSYEDIATKGRTVVDPQIYKMVKAELNRNWKRRAIAEFYNLSPTTVNLIRQSKNYKQYKILRREKSKPDVYKN